MKYLHLLICGLGDGSNEIRAFDSSDACDFLIESSDDYDSPTTLSFPDDFDFDTLGVTVNSLADAQSWVTPAVTGGDGGTSAETSDDLVAEEVSEPDPAVEAAPQIEAEQPNPTPQG